MEKNYGCDICGFLAMKGNAPISYKIYLMENSWAVKLTLSEITKIGQNLPGFEQHNVASICKE